MTVIAMRRSACEGFRRLWYRVRDVPGCTDAGWVCLGAATPDGMPLLSP